MRSLSYLLAAVCILAGAELGLSAGDSAKPLPGEKFTPPDLRERQQEKLKVGALAPDFTLSASPGKKEVKLSSFRGKRPVVLIFGSCTWPPFRRQSGDLEKLYRSYKDKAAFLLVYIREAHPGSVVTIVKDGKPLLDRVEQTNDLKERSARARQFVEAMKITIPLVVDNEDNQVNAAYAGWPERLYVIGTDGKVAYKGGPGPGGFKVAEVEKWLRDNTR